jgi:hypothetical protein
MKMCDVMPCSLVTNISEACDASIIYSRGEAEARSRKFIRKICIYLPRFKAQLPTNL